MSSETGDSEAIEMSRNEIFDSMLVRLAYPLSCFRLLTELRLPIPTGMPIFAPSSLSLGTADSTLSVAQFEEEAGGARIAIGVLSIVEELPRKVGSFGTAERAKLYVPFRYDSIQARVQS